MFRPFLALFAAVWAQAQPAAFWPGTQYDASIPTTAQVLGYQPGARISSHANLLRYFEALAAATPARMKIFDYGKTWEGRRLVYAAIGSEANIRRLTEIKESMSRLADPRRTSEAEAKKLSENLPAVVWLGHGVHGNEISSSDSALLVAYHLLAARNDAMVRQILASTLVLIDPIQNPDGRDRFVHNFEIAEGLEPDASPLAAEHNEPWPAGRTNHYHFDMNRDWFALTQPETRGRVKTLLEWFPVVFVDLHEMGSESTYYFTPEAAPINPHLGKELMESLEWIGRNNAKWFDHFGFSYFTREVYDNFYPGYGASWPCYYGSAAMTYEQASARGLRMRRSDGREFEFRDTVRQHFVASLATLESAARYRQQLISKLYRFRRSAMEEVRNEPTKEYVFPRSGNVTSVDKLAANLAAQGVEVKRATAAITVDGRNLPAGSYVVPLAQPAKRLIRVLLDKTVPMEADFLKEQERRRARKLPDEIYDVTGWSLPLLYNVEMLAASAETAGTFEPVAPGAMPKGRVIGDKAAVAYLVPWSNSGAAQLTAAALRQGYRGWSSDKSFRQGERTFPAGTVIFKVKENPETMAAVLARLAVEHDTEIVGTDSGWVEEGVNFGSHYVLPLRRPVIALAWDRPTSPGSAGHTRFVLERQFGLPVTAVRTTSLATADLRRFDVLILPDGADYTRDIGEGGLRRIKDWISAGGTLIAIRGAVSYLADPKVALLAVSQENRSGPEPPKKTEPAEPRVPGQIFTSQQDFDKAIRADKELPDQVAGVLVKARLDPDHWITAGAGATVNAMVDGSAIFTPIKLDKGFNPAVFASADELLESGYLWEDNRKQLAFKPLVIVQKQDRGQVIAFTTDPNFRAFLDGMNMLFWNAVLRGPARARPAP